MDLPKILLTIVIFTLCLIILQGIQTSAQTPNISGEIEKRIEQTSEAFIELTALLKQASTEISKLNGRLDVLESRERVLQKMYREMTEEMSLLRDLTQRAVAMRVSVSQFSIAWNQIDTILDKLDEITHQLSLPRSKSH
jgi:chromosome segregation ATPase